MKDAVLSSALVAGLLWAGSAAAASGDPAGSGAVSPGTARGTFTANGQPYTLAHAAAFTDSQDKSKTLYLLVTDEPMPVAQWTGLVDMKIYRRDHPFHGVAFRFFPDGTLVGADIYLGRFATSTGGYFEVEFTDGGKRLAGKAFSTAEAATSDLQMSLDVTFNAGPR